MNKENDKKFDGSHCPTPSSDPVMGEPEDSFDMVNKYGTYNIQPTSQTENSFPHIAQGLPKKRKTVDFLYNDKCRNIQFIPHRSSNISVFVGYDKDSKSLCRCGSATDRRSQKHYVCRKNTIIYLGQS